MCAYCHISDRCLCFGPFLHWKALHQKKAAFHVDFGADAGNDLWEHHLGTLRLDRKYRVPAWASRLFEAVVTAGIPVEGRTVGDLTAAYTSHVSSTGDVIDVGEYADLVPVPAKEQNQ